MSHAPPYTPSEAEVARFAAQGFLVTPVLFDDALLTDVHDEIMRVWHERNQAIAASNAQGSASMASYSRARPELQRAHLDSPQLASFCRHPQFAHVARALVGGDVDLSWNQAYTKVEGGDARTAIPWHQDDWYAEIDGPRINCWVAISDTTVENGTLWRAPKPEGLLHHVWDEPLLFYRCDVDESLAAPVELRRGQAFVFTGGLPHRSGINVSGASRVAYSISFTSSAARLRANGEPFGDRVPLLRGGASVRDVVMDYARAAASNEHLGARVVAEIAERAPRRASQLHALLDAARAAAAARDDGALDAVVGDLLAVLPDSQEVLGDLVRSRARVDQLLREIASVGGNTSELGISLLERVLELEPDNPIARAALGTRLDR